MNSVLADLRKDHQNMARLLVYMRSSLNLLDGANAKQEFARLADCLEFIAMYPDRVHHPRENVLFNILKEREKVFDRISVQLDSEHWALAQKTVALHKMCIELPAGKQDPSQISVKLNEFVDLQFKHMRYEEDTVFPLIEKSFDVADWKEALVARDPAGRNLFSADYAQDQEKKYQAIYRAYQQCAIHPT